MRFSLENFGPITKFEYDLTKDLIITYGNNNIGKSYSMSVLYLFLKPLVLRKNLANLNYRFFQLDSLQDITIEEIRKIGLSSSKPIDITSYINKWSIALLNELLLDEWKLSFQNTFGEINGISQFGKVDSLASIILNTTNISIELSIDSEMKIRDYSTCNIYKAKISDKNKRRRQSEISHIQINLEHTEELISYLSELVLENTSLLFEEVNKQISALYFLPASRSGIYTGMSAFSKIIAQLSKNRSVLSRKLELPGLSEPVADYFITLSEIDLRRNRPIKGLSRGFNTPLLVSNLIEEEILGGIVSFDKKNSQIVYTPNGFDRAFEMNNVSSMVSEISPIVAYLKFIIKETDLIKDRKAILFIEEPEAHLHPEIQVKLTESLTSLIGSNIKLIMTSHSNYIFNKLNNMVLSGSVDYNSYEPIHLVKDDFGSVSNHMEIDELGVYDSNFAKVAENIFDEREEIIHKLNEATDV